MVASNDIACRGRQKLELHPRLHNLTLTGRIARYDASVSSLARPAILLWPGGDSWWRTSQAMPLAFGCVLSLLSPRASPGHHHRPDAPASRPSEPSAIARRRASSGEATDRSVRPPDSGPPPRDEDEVRIGRSAHLDDGTAPPTVGHDSAPARTRTNLQNGSPIAPLVLLALTSVGLLALLLILPHRLSRAGGRTRK